MASHDQPAPKTHASHLHALNLVVALLAGLVSITGGVYTIKNNFFPSQSYGSLQGVVRDSKLAKPLLLAMVEVSTPEGAVVNTSPTDPDGRYFIEKLKTGNYDVKLSAARHASQTKKVKIEKEITSAINVDLVPVEEPAAAVVPTAERVLPVVPQPVPAPVASVPVTAPPAAYSSPVDSAPVTATTRRFPSYDDEAADSYPNPSPYRRHRHPPMPGGYPSGSNYGDPYGDNSATAPGTADSGSGALVQAVLPIVQEMFAKKSDQNTSST